MIDDLATLGRTIVDSALYLVLGTADADGRPWAAPVYFAHDGYRDFIWVSKPGSRHSRNIAVRPEINIVVFDSSVPIGTGRGAVYAPAMAAEVNESDRNEALATFSRRSIDHGGREFTPDDVIEPSRLRLYKATAADQFVLDERDERVSLTL